MTKTGRSAAGNKPFAQLTKASLSLLRCEQNIFGRTQIFFQ
jgi:hypothetical protein